MHSVFCILYSVFRIPYSVFRIRYSVFCIPYWGEDHHFNQNLSGESKCCPQTNSVYQPLINSLMSPSMAKVGRFLFFNIMFGIFPLVSDVVESRLVSVKSRSVFVVILTVLAFC